MDSSENMMYSQNQAQKPNQPQGQTAQHNFTVPTCFKQIQDIYDDDQASLMIIEQLENLCLEVTEDVNEETNTNHPQGLMDVEEGKKNQVNQNHYYYESRVHIESNFVLAFNKDINAMTITKYFKQESRNVFEKEMNILKKLENTKITLPIVSSGVRNNQFYYEQIAGQKDFLLFREDYKHYNNYFIDFLILKLFIKLEALHNIGIAHSDIKPQNIVVGYDNQPYFIDFGGAVESNNFKDYLRQFTPLYNVSPYYEQIGRNNSKEYKKHTFTSAQEIFHCDTLQLVMTSIYMYYCNDMVQKNIFKSKNFEKFRIEHNTSSIQEYLFLFLGLEKKPKRKELIEGFHIHLPVQDMTSLILEIKDVEIKTNPQGMPQCILKRINQNSMHMIPVLIDLFGQLSLSDECTTIYYVPNQRQYEIIYTLYYYYVDYFQGVKNQNIQIHLNIYNHTQPQQQNIHQGQLEQQNALIKPFIYHLSINFVSTDNSINWIKFHVRYAIYHSCKHFNLNKFTITIYQLKDDYIEFFKELDTYNIKNTEIEIVYMSNTVDEKYYQLFTSLQQKNKYKYKYIVNFKKIDLLNEQEDDENVQQLNCSMQYVGILSQGKEQVLENPSEGVIKFIRFTDDPRQKKFYGADTPEQITLDEKRKVFNQLFMANMQYQHEQQKNFQAIKEDLIKKYNYIDFDSTDIFGRQSFKINDQVQFQLHLTQTVKK